MLIDVSLDSDPNSGLWLSLDWHPSGDSLLLSKGRTITTIDVTTAESKEILQGGNARWSPSGDAISFRTLQRHAALWDPATGKTRIIYGTPGYNEIRWSPDGQHLLFFFHGKFGSNDWIHRISDGARATFRGGQGAPDWLQLP